MNAGNLPRLLVGQQVLVVTDVTTLQDDQPVVAVYTSLDTACADLDEFAAKHDRPRGVVLHLESCSINALHWGNAPDEDRTVWEGSLADWEHERAVAAEQLDAEMRESHRRGYGNNPPW